MFHSRVIGACLSVTTDSIWRRVNVRTTTTMLFPAVRGCTGTTTVRDPQTGTAYPCFWHVDLCLSDRQDDFFLVHLFLIHKPALNLAVLVILFACKMKPNSVTLASGGAFSGILWRRLRRALWGRLQRAPLGRWGLFWFASLA